MAMGHRWRIALLILVLAGIAAAGIFCLAVTAIAVHQAQLAVGGAGFAARVGDGEAVRLMADDHEFRVRPGRIRSTRAQSARPVAAKRTQVADISRARARSTAS